MKKKVLLGLSGGIDSSLSIKFLLQKNYHVDCIFLQNWDDQINFSFDHNQNEEKFVCDYIQDYNDAKQVAAYFNVKLIFHEFIQEYWNLVFHPFLEQLKLGYTPNPDVTCNKYIKFNALAKLAFGVYNYDYLATGHYAKLEFNQDLQKFELYQPKDLKKDQTYFLNQINIKWLDKILFPLKNYLKTELYGIAHKLNLHFLFKKESSSGVCFIGERNFTKFLKNYLPIKKGSIIDLDTNEEIGQHDGYYFYTIGQIKHLNLYKSHLRYAIVNKDIKKNLIYAQKLEIAKTRFILNFNVINFNKLVTQDFKLPYECYFKCRHSIETFYCKIIKFCNNNLVVEGNFPYLQLVPGQFAVFYLKNGLCLGGGIIDFHD